MFRIKNILKSQEGAALILVLFLVTVVAVGGGALIVNSFYSTENSVYAERKLDATQRAKGGIEEGLAYIEQEIKEGLTITERDFSHDEWYEVNISLGPEEDEFTVQSTAKYMTISGEKPVTYTVNGIMGIEIVGLSSILFDYSVVTVGGDDDNGFEAEDYKNLHIKGDLLGTLDLDNPRNFKINGTIGDPMALADFINEFNALKEYFDNLYPLPENLSSLGTERIRNSATFPTVLEKNEIIIEDGKGKITFEDDVYANSLIIEDGEYDITFEGNVHVKNLFIDNLKKSKIKFNGNVIVDGKFEVDDSELDLTVIGLVLTEKFEYEGEDNNKKDIDISYIVALHKIEIEEVQNVHLGGMAAPEISFEDIQNIHIYSQWRDGIGGSNDSSGTPSLIVSYNITDWDVN